MKSFFKKSPARGLLLTLLAIATGMTLSFLLPATQKQSDFQHFLSHQFIDEVTSNTLNLHYTLKNPSALGIKSYDVRLFDRADTDPLESASQYKELRSKLQSYSYRSLSSDEKLVYDVFWDYLNRQIRLLDFALYEELLTPSGGVSSQLPILFAEYPLNTKQDVEDYLALLSQMDAYFASILDYEKERADAGLFMSDHCCEKVISGCEVFLRHPTDNFLFTTFEDRLNRLEGLSASAREKYMTEHAKIMAEHVIPAYENLSLGLNNLMGKGRNDWGLCYYRDGSAYYSALVAAYTGCDETVEELASEIDEMRKSDLAQCTAILAETPELTAQAESVEISFDSPEAMLMHLQTAMLKDFPEAPDAKWQISYVDPCLKDYLAPAFYITAPIDAYHNHCIYINDAKDYDSLHLFTTLAHEGFPGHLYQTMLSYDYGMNPLHTLLNYPGYTEGWATYVEMLSYHYLGLDENMADLLQHNQSVILSLYATSDIGIHYLGWKTEEMEAFWKNYGITDSNTIEAITNLILEEPGNYLKYYVGYMKFCQIRKRCEEKQKEHFDPVAFHKQILEIGPVPFALLEKKLCD